MDLIPVIRDGRRIGWEISPADCRKLAGPLTETLANCTAAGEPIPPLLQRYVDGICAVAQAWTGQGDGDPDAPQEQNQEHHGQEQHRTP